LGGADSGYAKCSISNEIPASFRNVAYINEREAKELRKQKKDLRTKVEIVKGIAYIKERIGRMKQYEFYEPDKLAAEAASTGRSPDQNPNGAT
jgi:hypothetical protein